MSTPQMPNIPGAAVMTDTLDFVKSLWGSMGVPGLASPTLSVDELDKKINDLKAVEAWLNLNTTMLRSSIQALEVQRNTIATLKSMGQSLADSMQQKPGRTEKSLYDTNPYAAAFFSHLDPAKVTPKPPAAATGVPKPEARQEAKPEAKPPGGQAGEALPKPDLAAAAAAQMANPAAWWNLLQEQFTQAVSTAMAADPKAAGAGSNGSDHGSDHGGDHGSEHGSEQRNGNESGGRPAAEPAADAGAARRPAARKAAPKKE